MRRKRYLEKFEWIEKRCSASLQPLRFKKIEEAIGEVDSLYDLAAKLVRVAENILENE
ncbi:hypothetical protein [Ferroglobus sp.]|uniref:hypothetical protein n=1 Tax=Ferroglobus sp. TaxID=2614230 RepID=UPI0025BEA1B1|nr:hypothetical protein [Ferroglobus sp.]